MSKYKVSSEYMAGEGAHKMVTWRVNGSYSFTHEEDACEAIDFVEAETAPLHDELAAMQVVLDAQSAEIARLKQARGRIADIVKSADSMSPLEALTKMYEIKRIIESAMLISYPAPESAAE